MKNQQIIILGGSSGMGFATAQLALEAGAQVSLTGLREETTATALERLPLAQGQALDIQDEAAVQHFFDQFEAIDHVFVAAGSTRLGSILEGTVPEQIKPIELRLVGSVYAIRAAAPKMKPGGSFIFTGGLSTDRPVPGAWVSGVGTAAAEQLARVMALELAPIRFNAISPGYVNTPMWDQVLGENKEEVLRGVAENMLLKRIVEPEEIAQAVLFLMQNRAITGEILHVDAGARLV